MNDTNEVELTRLKMGCWIVGWSIFAVVACLAFVIAAPAALPNAADKVALMGSVTTFLGAVVGVFFGVNSSGSSRAQTAANAAENNKTVTTLAAAATTATEAAARSVAASHAFVAQIATSPHTMSALSSAASLVGPMVAPVTPPIAGEMLRGDPDETPQALILPSDHLSTIEMLSSPSFAFVERPVAASTLFGAAGVLAVAGGEAAANISRATARPRVTEYLKLLGLDFLDEHGVPTRFCAAGLTWSACKAYCDAAGLPYDDGTRLAVLRSVLPNVRKLAFKPSASCQAMVDDARQRGTWRAKVEAPKPGYIVFFNWAGEPHAEHVGWVEHLDDGVLHTIEFNTTADDGPYQGDGGCVAHKIRKLKFVIGYIATF